jgi:NADH dehydrogenase
MVDQCCGLPGYERVWAIGDCVEVPEPEGDGIYAPTAQNATRQGERVAKNVVGAMLTGAYLELRWLQISHSR